MKKIILTEAQIKKILDTVIKEKQTKEKPKRNS